MGCPTSARSPRPPRRAGRRPGPVARRPRLAPARFPGASPGLGSSAPSRPAGPGRPQSPHRTGSPPGRPTAPGRRPAAVPVRRPSCPGPARVPLRAAGPSSSFSQICTGRMPPAGSAPARAQTTVKHACREWQRPGPRLGLIIHASGAWMAPTVVLAGPTGARVLIIHASGEWMPRIGVQIFTRAGRWQRTTPRGPSDTARPSTGPGTTATLHRLGPADGTARMHPANI